MDNLKFNIWQQLNLELTSNPFITIFSFHSREPDSRGLHNFSNYLEAFNLLMETALKGAPTTK